MSYAHVTLFGTCVIACYATWLHFTYCWTTF